MRCVFLEVSNPNKIYFPVLNIGMCCAGAAGKPDNIPECLQARNWCNTECRADFIYRMLDTNETVDTTGSNGIRTISVLDCRGWIDAGSVLDDAEATLEARREGDGFVDDRRNSWCRRTGNYRRFPNWCMGGNGQRIKLNWQYWPWTSYDKDDDLYKKT